MSETTLKHTLLTIKNKKSSTLDGVENVEGFDENYVVLSTTAGRISVEGQGLKIQSLSQQNGEIHIVGDIAAVYYSEIRKPKGILSKLFR